MAGILKQDYNYQNIFLGCNRYEDGTYTNSTGSSVNLTKGMVMGQVLATAKWLPQASAATDGSEMPRAVLAEDYTVANGATVKIALCKGGQVNQNAITLNGSDTLDTPVRSVSTGGGTIKALLLQNSQIELIPSTELSGLDN